MWACKQTENFTCFVSIFECKIIEIFWILVLCLCQLIWLPSKVRNECIKSTRQKTNQCLSSEKSKSLRVVIISCQTLGICLPLITESNYCNDSIFLLAFNFILNTNMAHDVYYSSIWNYILYLIWNFRDSKTCHPSCKIQNFFLRTWNLCLWIYLRKREK